MNDLSSYPGQELELFEKAVNWKQYFSSFIKPYIKTEVLETGAGLGSNTLLLNDGSARLWTLQEPDITMSALLQKKIQNHELPLNCQVIRDTLPQLKNTQQFDTIIYIDVMEHIENDIQETEIAVRMLKPGGHLIILAPACQFLYSPFDKTIGHYRRYNKRHLEKNIQGRLTPVHLRYLDSTGFFMSMANRLLLKQKYPTKKQVHFWDKYLITLSRIIDRIVIYSFGKTILGIWKKEK